MSSNRIDQEKSFELIQKTYPNQTEHQSISSIMHPITTMRKISSHQLSRKSSVHDINEVFKEDFQKKLIEIHERLSRLKYFFEMNHCYSQMLSEYQTFKSDILEKITNLILKFSHHHQMKGSIGTTKENGNNFINASELVHLIEFIRNEFFKIQYLFHSTITHSHIDLPNFHLKPIELFEQNLFQDELNQLKRDSNYLEEQAYLLSQRYYCQIPDWSQCDGPMIQLNSMKPTSKINRNETNGEIKPMKRNARRSSISSNGNHSYENEFMHKCFSFCCLCTPKYL